MTDQAKTDPYDRRQVLVAWLTANGINAKAVLRDSDLTISTDPAGTQTLHYEACVLDPEGRRIVDERGTGFAMERRTAVLTVPPPEWFVPYEKPTRHDLLDTVERCRALIAAGPDTGLVVSGEHKFGWDAAMQSIRRAIGERPATPTEPDGGRD